MGLPCETRRLIERVAAIIRTFIEQDLSHRNPMFAVLFFLVPWLQSGNELKISGDSVFGGAYAGKDSQPTGSFNPIAGVF